MGLAGGAGPRREEKRRARREMAAARGRLTPALGAGLSSLGGFPLLRGAEPTRVIEVGAIPPRPPPAGPAAPEE